MTTLQRICCGSLWTLDDITHVPHIFLIGCYFVVPYLPETSLNRKWQVSQKFT